MSSETFSVTRDPDLDRAIERRRLCATTRGSRSRLVAQLVARYVEITERCCPKLRPAEWDFLEDLFKTTQFDAAVIDGLGAMVRIPLPVGHRLRVHQVDPEVLGAKISKLDYGGRLAIVDRIERAGHEAQRLLNKRIDAEGAKGRTRMGRIKDGAGKPAASPKSKKGRAAVGRSRG